MFSRLVFSSFFSYLFFSSVVRTFSILSFAIVAFVLRLSIVSFFASGAFPSKINIGSAPTLIYEIVLESQKSAIKNSVKGSNSTNVHNVALRILVEGLKEIGLLKGDTDGIIENGSYKHLYMHRTGHWLGLDVHDVGAYRMGEYDVPLQNGMILTVEPGIYISDRIPVPEGQPSFEENGKV